MAEEIFLETGIIEEKKVEPQVIKDPFVLHQTIIEDLKQQLDELTELTGNVTGAMSDLSEKHKEILTTYQNLCSMSVDDIKRVLVVLQFLCQRSQRKDLWSKPQRQRRNPLSPQRK